MNDELPHVYALADLMPGMGASVPFTVGEDELWRFAELSGDYNPLHVDGAFARSKGFEGKVVYGALLVAKVSQLIGMHLPGRDALWTRVTLDFVRPLYVDQAARVDGVVEKVSASVGLMTLKIGIVTGNGLVLARGSAEVLLVER
ncbi:MAG: MaoC/PaaZ C-terminal domain-containing protein [Rhodocyclaceae bacterium]